MGGFFSPWTDAPGVFPLQLGGFGALLSLLVFVVWVAVIIAIFDIRRATKRTAAATERIAD